MKFHHQRALRAETECPLLDPTLHGTYVVSGSGIVGGGPLAGVGEHTYDGQGHSVATLTLSVNGMIHRGVFLTGTYTVNSDCTMTLAESDGGTYDYVVAPDGRTTTWISTGADTVLSGTEVRLRR